MAVRESTVEAGPDVVWSLLADGWSYSLWVPGTQTIREVDATWPREGSRLHYQAGFGPVHFAQQTVSLGMVEGVSLDLEAHAWPAGTAYVGLRLAAAPGGCLVRCEETALRGPGKVLHNPVSDAAVGVRLDLLLHRLGHLARWRQRSLSTT